MSRAKVRGNLLVMQAFSPALFGHGPPPGPHILMRLLRGDLARDQVEGEFDRLLEQKKEEKKSKRKDNKKKSEVRPLFCVFF